MLKGVSGSTLNVRIRSPRLGNDNVTEKIAEGVRVRAVPKCVF